MKAAGGTNAQLNLMNLHAESRKEPAGSSQYVPVSAYTEEIMNRVSGHVGSGGRNQYDTSMEEVKYYINKQESY
jgi:hypothetical protein